jgi:hypothetical protein
MVTKGLTMIKKTLPGLFLSLSQADRMIEGQREVSAEWLLPLPEGITLLARGATRSLRWSGPRSWLGAVNARRRDHGE